MHCNLVFDISYRNALPRPIYFYSQIYASLDFRICREKTICAIIAYGKGHL